MFGAALLAIGMLFSGSINTISNEFMDKVHSKGLSNPSTFWSKEDEEASPSTDGIGAFDHPFVQAEFMFVGEATCMLLFLYTNWQARKHNPSTAWRNQHGWKAIFCYACTASCDMTATSMMYAGLALSSASIYQMLRGAIVVFTALLSVVCLRKKLYAFHWTAVLLVVIGVSIVGAQSIIQSSSSGGGSGVILGIILILAAQVVQAVQVVAQEKFIRKFETPEFLLVGLEGIFGATILGILLVPMYFVHIGGYPIEDAGDAWEQIKNSPSELPTGHPNWHLPVGNALFVAILGNIASIAFFNVFGIKITTVLSGSHRMVLDSMRTCVVWGVALILGWEEFHLLQLVGFMIMLAGTALYNEIVRVPFLFSYPARELEFSEPLKETANLDGNINSGAMTAAIAGA